ncbi:MAG: hypothetical protein JXB10_00130 [Pirellulales bacterium]|nr:hypothetical protein [Pirellulales bacterium]
MSSIKLEKRVAALEEELARLKSKVETAETAKPWWERIAGTFEKDPIYEKAMKLGRKYRHSLDPRNSARKQK